jgi:hypothetical protein
MMTDAKRTAAAVLVVALAVASLVASSALALSLAKYPSLQCSACRATMEILGERMNESAAKRQTILHSHRLEGGDRRIDYESSELRGYELVEKLCEQNNFGSFMLREEPRTGLRIFSREAPLQNVMPYDDEDRKELHDVMTSKLVSKVCEEILEEHEEMIVAAVQKLRRLDELAEHVCATKARLCLGKRYVKGVTDDLNRRAAWRKRTGIRTGTDVDNDKARESAEAKAKAKVAEAAAPPADAAGDAPAAAPVPVPPAQPERPQADL